ncbi:MULTISPECIES: UDP-glucose 4-epimerase GalE [unclassified Leifsonia]|uniref:UDP-glucose 4-epimerase GalE n=1 Tax=unclassified Leifsonia TaxID=2663824 RepID=UPI0006FEF22C|nr:MULTISPECIES: UDP-glucose 4-epimerase GalE [unclassified Leifsonia]KQX06861.1 UDP-glucose 4-epimerase [Leifsonia sp. Root1293]KRA11146.1 UDP-glucose 4-epimerase [Leifsonia sp. Root60]
MTVMVTGGAGYIGAHVVRLLQEAHVPVVVVDDLSTGAAERVSGAPLVALDVAASDAVDAISAAMTEHSVDAVIHFAAKKQVGESVGSPVWYFQQNVGGLANVLAAAEQCGVERFVFSSSAAVYGMTGDDLVTEDAPVSPINPYGQTKLAGEWLLRDAARAFGMRTVSLRYFNVAGAGWRDLGDPQVLNLITIVLDRIAAGDAPTVFGTGFDTEDGSGVRDYVHVLDIAAAHIDALDYLGRDERAHDVFNVGRGEGSSVLEVIAAIAAATGTTFTPVIAEARPGDPARVIADATRLRAETGWAPKHGFDEIIASAVAAASANPQDAQPA